MKLPPVILLAFLTACVGPGAGGDPTPTPTPQDHVAHPEGDSLVLRVEHVGGFVPATFHLTRLPLFSLTGDGRVITQGAVPAIFPGPALPAVMVRRLSEEGMQSVLRAVAATGQFGTSAEWRGAANMVADASDTVFTLHADGREVTVTVYALGILDGAMPNIGAEERAAHVALSGLVEQLTMLDTELAGSAWLDAEPAPYRAEALRLLVRTADADPPDDSGLEAVERRWPAGGDPATFGDPTPIDGSRCGVVSGDVAEAWYEALETANQLTRWTAGRHRYEVTVRPILPGEAATCPDLG